MFYIQSMLGIWPGLSLKYDMKMYLKYAEALKEKCDELEGNEDDDLSEDQDSKAQEEDDDGDDDETKNEFVLTPWILGECLWTEYMINKMGKNEKTKEKKVNDKTNTKTKKSRKRKLSNVDEDDSSQRVKRLKL